MVRYPIGTRVRLILNKGNIIYFNDHFNGYKVNGVYMVTGHYNTDCIYIDTLKYEPISCDRFEEAPTYEGLPDELFTLT